MWLSKSSCCYSEAVLDNEFETNWRTRLVLQVSLTEAISLKVGEKRPCKAEHECVYLRQAHLGKRHEQPDWRPHQRITKDRPNG